MCLTWCFFRLTKFTESVECVRKAFVFDGDKMFAGGSADLTVWVLLGGYGAVTALAHGLGRGAGLATVEAGLAERQFLRGVAGGGA